MRNNNGVIKVSFEYKPGFSEMDIEEEIKTRVIMKLVDKHTKELEISFIEKVSSLVENEVMKLISDLDGLTVMPCTTLGIKEPTTLKQFIITKAITTLTQKVDKDGRPSNYDGKSFPEYVANKILYDKESAFRREIEKEAQEVQNIYSSKLSEVMAKTIAPIYQDALKKLGIK